MAFGAATHVANPLPDGLVTSHCDGCGLLIAASPRRKILEVMEQIHVCPVYFHYPHVNDEADDSEGWSVPMAGRCGHFLIYLQ